MPGPTPSMNLNDKLGAADGTGSAARLPGVQPTTRLQQHTPSKASPTKPPDQATEHTAYPLDAAQLWALLKSEDQQVAGVSAALRTRTSPSTNDSQPGV
mmetsp:Transcript_82049/g.219540  ORF Transcript_82049/g.219540 Transcript_82049/m.219540 type:complete len:99 (-) Transcript_82049:3851-4147(-)